MLGACLQGGTFANVPAAELTTAKAMPCRSARLTDGRVVILEKDCNCATHDGPHWLHMDSVDKSLNAGILNKSSSIAELRAFAEAEQRRLAGKLREMNQRQIVEIL